MQTGTLDEVWIDGVLIEDCGSDGIDIKDWNSANRTVRITDCVVRRFGRKADQAYAGIDVRGLAVSVSGCTVEEYGDLGPTYGAAGIRTRFGESNAGSASWGAHSRASATASSAPRQPSPPGQASSSATTC